MQIFRQGQNCECQFKQYLVRIFVKYFWMPVAIWSAEITLISLLEIHMFCKAWSLRSATSTEQDVQGIRHTMICCVCSTIQVFCLEKVECVLQASAALITSTLLYQRTASTPLPHSQQAPLWVCWVLFLFLWGQFFLEEICFGESQWQQLKKEWQGKPTIKQCGSPGNIA